MSAAKRGAMTLRSQVINKGNKDTRPEETDTKPAAEKPVKKTQSKPKAKANPVTQKEKDYTTVRDSFTMPQCDYDLIEEIKIALAKQGMIMTKGEILRAGLIALNDMADSRKVAVAKKVEKVKTGRKKAEG